MNMNTFIRRHITDKLDKLLIEKPIIVITGMRQVGKTTQLNYLYNKIHSSNKLWITLEDVLQRKIFATDNYQDIKRNLEQEGVTFDTQSYIFIDEIQYIKNLPSIMKYFYDEYNVKFAVTGSSSYYLKHYFTESLAGRKIVIELYPLTFREFLSFKNINKTWYDRYEHKANKKTVLDEQKYGQLYAEYMEYGGFPAVVKTQNKSIKKALLKDILNSYFQLDVTTIADFSDIGKLRDLLILLTQRIGQKMSISSLANALQINRVKVYEYLELLQATYVIRTISQKSSIDNQISADNKIFFNDIGLANILADIAIGNKFENAISMNLAYENNIMYFQTKSGGEIDFIIDKKIGFEIKVNPIQKDLANLKKRARSAGIDTYYLVGLKYNKGVDNLIMAWDL